MRIIPLQADTAPLLDPDIIWDGIAGDLLITSATDPVNPAGLRAEQALATSVLICLMTDIRVEASELPAGEANRGWPGDAFDLGAGDVALGSKLWLLRRRALTPGLEIVAEDYARQALQTLVDQRAFARFDVAATARRVENRLDLDIQGFGRDGANTFDRRFAILWDQLAANTDPLTLRPLQPPDGIEFSDQGDSQYIPLLFEDI